MLDKEAVRQSSRVEQVIPSLLGATPKTINSHEVAVACPWHEDRSPSLRINADKQVWRCDPCNVGGDVFKFVERHQQTDFNGALRWLAERSNITSQERRIVSTYDYRDENNEVRYQVVRFEPKDFRQRQPDGKGGWTWNMNGVRRVLYRLNQLQGKDSVYIVEGEKDADALWQSELPATTNPGGAGKWNIEFARQLKAAGVRRVAVIPDHDEPGRAHAVAIARTCHGEGIAARIVNLPDVPAKGDVSDYLVTHDIASLRSLVRGTTEYQPAPETPPTSSREPPPRKEKPLAAGQSLAFEELEPWSEPVDGGGLLDDLRAFIVRFAVLASESADAITLWIVHSYLMTIWRISPFAVANSPTKQCGKTKLLEVVSALVFRPLTTSNITPAALFRVIDKFTPTLLFDEAENWITDKASELRGLLNAGHTRRTAVSVRTVGDKHEVAVFSTWAPKFIALIGTLPDTMMDRSVVIPMRRKRKDERVDVLLEHELTRATLPLRRRIIRFTDDYGERLSAVRPEPVAGLRDRAVDNWSPLFAIADVVGGEWPDRARKAALALSGGAETSDDTPGLQLLSDCHEIWQERGADSDQIASADLVKQLNELADRPWADFRGGKGISAAWLAKRLKAFDVAPSGNIRFNGKQSKGYRWSAFTDGWSRYQVLQPYHRPNVNESGPETTFSNRPTGENGTDAKTEIQSTNPGLWDGGTDTKQDPGRDDDWGDV